MVVSGALAGVVGAGPMGQADPFRSGVALFRATVRFIRIARTGNDANAATVAHVPYKCLVRKTAASRKSAEAWRMN